LPSTRNCLRPRPFLVRGATNKAKKLALDDGEFAPPRPRALVVLGAQRSGTTLVATALAAHPAIALLMEERRGGLFRIAGGKMPAVKLCTPSQVDLDRRWRAIYQLGRRIGQKWP